MIIAIKTDTATAEVTLLSQSGSALQQYSEELGRQTAKELPGKVSELLEKQGVQMTAVTGVIYFRGPGSFTGLRIGAAIANAIAYGANAPLVSAAGETWLRSGYERLKNGENDVSALPEYGAEAHITKPRK